MIGALEAVLDSPQKIVSEIRLDGARSCIRCKIYVVTRECE